jgi:CheY-like chemotaxis protein
LKPPCLALELSDKNYTTRESKCGYLPSLRLRANRSHQNKHCETYSDLKEIRADFFDFEAETGKNFISALHKHSQPGAASMVFPNRNRILLVEDYEDVRDLATLTLTEYTLTCARNFNEGLRLARQECFDLYILDNWLPDKSGVELCRAIREFDSDTPILFYSAAAYAKDVQEGLLAGAQAYLVKPVIPDELRRTVAQLISGTPGTTP